MVFIIIIAILLAILCYWLGRRKSNIQQIEKNSTIEQLNQKLDKMVEDKTKQISDYDEAIHKLQVEYEDKAKSLASGIEFLIRNEENRRIEITKSIDEQLQEYRLKAKEEQMKIENDMNFIKDYRFSKISQAATAYRQEELNKIHTDAAAAEQEIKQKIDELIAYKLQVQSQVGELQASRDALIEAYKREEELKLEKNFYQVVLTEKDNKDIRILKTIEDSLNNKECLYKLIWSVFYMTPTKEMLNRIIGKDKQSGIYKITNQLNGKVYIGQSVDLHTRLTNHIKAGIGISGTIARQLVHDALFEDGIENFTFEVVEKCPKEQLNKKEKLWIETYSSDKYGYNRTAGGAKEV